MIHVHVPAGEQPREHHLHDTDAERSPPARCLHCGGERITATSDTTGCCDGERRERGYGHHCSDCPTPGAGAVATYCPKCRHAFELPEVARLQADLARMMIERDDAREMHAKGIHQQQGVLEGQLAHMAHLRDELAGKLDAMTRERNMAVAAFNVLRKRVGILEAALVEVKRLIAGGKR